MQSDLSSVPPITVSVVVPVYSGADYLDALLAEIERVRTTWSDSGAPLRLVEAILVDDAAVDSSPEIADQLAHEMEWVTVIHLARNFGQHPATRFQIVEVTDGLVFTPGLKGIRADAVQVGLCTARETKYCHGLALHRRQLKSRPDTRKRAAVGNTTCVPFGNGRP